jgi:hypothetical protein
MVHRRRSHSALLVALLALAVMAPRGAATAVAGAGVADKTEPAVPPSPDAPPHQDAICGRLQTMLSRDPGSAEHRKAAETYASLHCAPGGAAGSSRPGTPGQGAAGQ